MIHRSKLLRMIDEGEHQQQDFKFAISDSKKIARSLVAFANTDGGRLLIGVKDNGAVAGVRSEEEFYMIEAAAQMYCKPAINYGVNQHYYQGKTVLEIVVEASDFKLHKAPNKDGDYKVYTRVNDQNLLANSVYIRAMQQRLKPNNVLRVSKPVELLLHYFENNNEITFSAYMRLARISRKITLQILAQLVSLEILTIHFYETGVKYRYNEENAQGLSA